jgi:hypothetical protein
MRVACKLQNYIKLVLTSGKFSGQVPSLLSYLRFSQWKSDLHFSELPNGYDPPSDVNI